MKVYCRLREIMQERHITVDALHKRARVGREAISALRSNSFERVSRVAIGRVCEALDIAINELFVLIPEDIWAPIRLAREVTIHYGSRSFAAPRKATGGPEDSLLSQQYIGARDMRAFLCIWEYLTKLGVDVKVRFQEHLTGVGRGYDPSVRDAVRQVFERGNHVVIGSPIANQFAEEVVCYAHNVEPYAPSMRQAFPYSFVWDSRRTIPSSFGWQGQGRDFGIHSARSGNLIAKSTIVREGEGEDCALILVQRIFQPQAARPTGVADERIVIGVLGHRGPGTEAAARVTTDPKYVAGLYPPERGKPYLRVVGAKYTRAPDSSLLDNRQLTEAYLIDEPKDPSDGPAARPAGKPRRGSPTKPADSPSGRPKRASTLRTATALSVVVSRRG
jgi:DNA-binding Xre family transcriptional regulator